VDGDTCHTQVVWAMDYGIKEHPDWYSVHGLSSESSFEDFQMHIYQEHPELGCQMPCPRVQDLSSNSSKGHHRTGSTTTVEDCETARNGSECYDAVLWAAQVGTCKHPEWYPGLSRKSTMESFQRHLHLTDESKSGPVCPMPCDGETAVPKRRSSGPSLFCFAVANEDYEMEIVKYQHDSCAGIFDCDEAVIVSNFDDAGGVPALKIEPVYVGMSQDGFAANTEVFMEAWNAVRDHGRFNEFEFTIKADPDCVLVPDRMRTRLGWLGSGPFYVVNCDRDGLEEPMMFGAVEALSLSAVLAYFDGQDRCRNELPWQAWGEDKFLGKCLDLLGAQRATDYDLLHDQRCLGAADCANEAPGAFHPFKSAPSWQICWEQATSEPAQV